MTIDAMKAMPERERDALLAQRLFDWVWVRLKPEDLHGSPVHRWLAPCSGEYSEPAEESDQLSSDSYSEVPRYSSDPAAMKLVIEAMAKQGWWCRAESPMRLGDPHFAGFSRHGKIMGGFMAHAPTTEAAVVIAAILALSPAAVPEGVTT